MQSPEEQNRIPVAILPRLVARGESGAASTYIFNNAGELLRDRAEINRGLRGDMREKDSIGMELLTSILIAAFISMCLLTLTYKISHTTIIFN
jgi:hypothetical protein